MVKIKQLITPDDDLYNYFLQYCIRSKPYDFCELKSSKLRNAKIKEYFNILTNDPIIFVAEMDSKIFGCTFFSKEKDHLILEFVIGDSRFGSNFLIKNLHEMLILSQKIFDKKETRSTIQRKHKKQKYINWIKRYDKVCEITEIEGETQIIWKNERLNQNNRNE